MLLTTSREGTGIPELAAAIAAHQAWLAALPMDSPRRARRIERELDFVLRSRVAEQIERGLAAEIAALARRVSAGELTQWAAAEQLLGRLSVR